MNLRSSMQMLNLGLSIVNKVQTMQHRQIKIAQSLSGSRKNRGETLQRIQPNHNESAIDAILDEDLDSNYANNPVAKFDI